jgi:hypothetical protein
MHSMTLPSYAASLHAFLSCCTAAFYCVVLTGVQHVVDVLQESFLHNLRVAEQEHHWLAIHTSSPASKGATHTHLDVKWFSCMLQQATPAGAAYKDPLQQTYYKLKPCMP